MVLHWDASELWERRLEVLQLQSIWPVVLVRGSQDLEDFEDLIDLTVSHEKRFLLGHLSEDASCGPQIYS